MAASIVVETRTFPWWVVLIEGTVAVVIGALLLTAPQATVALVIQVFGLYWLVDGILRIVSIFTDPVDRVLKLEAGAIGILAGIAVLLRPLWLATMLTWMLVVALGMAGVVVGALTLVHAFRGGGWGAAVAGVLSLLFGVVLLLNPLVDWVAWGQVYGWLSLAGGAIAIVLAMRMRRNPAMQAPDPRKETT